MIQTVLTSAAVLLRILSNPFGNVLQKQLTRNNHPLLVNFLTYLLLSCGCLWLAATTHWHELPRQFWIYSLGGGLAGALGNGLLVKALKTGDLSILGPINAYKSVVGMVAAVFLLGELPNLRGLAGIALMIAGSYYVLDTTEEPFSFALLQKPEIQYRIWAMILAAVEAVFIKKIILASSVTLAFVVWSGFGALFALLLLWVSRIEWRREIRKLDRSNASQYAWLVVCVGTMQFTTNYTLDHLPVGYALSLFQLSTIVSVLLGHRFFKERDVRKKLLGTAIMMAGSVMILLFKDG